MLGFVYKWTNTFNGKWYIGSHEGKESDGYIGSGVIFNYALEKYGIESFRRDILYTGDDFRIVEKLILIELDAMHDPMSYNLINESVCMSGANNPMFGRKRQDISDLNKERCGEKHHMFRKKNPILTRENKLRIEKKNPMFGRKGEKSPTAKLSQSQADEIRDLIAKENMTLKQIGVKFGVSRFTIARIRDGVIYIK